MPENETDAVTEAITSNQDFKISASEQALSSCCGALLTSLCVTPLDVVKTRLQAQQGFNNGSLRFNGTLDGIIKIARYEGITNLWSGLGATLFLSVPSAVIFFTAYEELRYFIKDRFYKSEPHPPVWVSMVSGATARICTGTVVSPLELIKTKLQSANITYSEVAGVLRNAIKRSGPLVLWQGVFSTLLRDVIFSTVFWMYYDTFKIIYNIRTPSFQFTFWASAASGAMAALLTVPFDVVKTNQQIDLKNKSGSTWRVMQQIYHHHGISGLTAGLVPRLLRIVPSCAITMSTIEYSKKYFISKHVDNARSKQISDKSVK